MSKEDMVELQGVVTEAQPGAAWRVKLDNGLEVRAHLSGKLRINFIRVSVGDRVTVQMSPYDVTRGRIVWRYK